MNVVIFGPPGAGKGTQAQNIAKKFNLHQVSTGDLLREEIKNKTKLGEKISSIIGFTLYKNYNCGEVSKENLETKVDRSKIKCISSSKDRYQRYLSKCFKDKINLNRWMVRNGHAVAYKRYSQEYVPDEDFAKANKLGLWQGKFLDPEKWRKLN